MPKFHIEQDWKVVQTCVYEVEAKSVEAAIQEVEKSMHQPCDVINHEAYDGPDYQPDDCYEIKAAQGREGALRKGD